MDPYQLSTTLGHDQVATVGMLADFLSLPTIIRFCLHPYIRNLLQRGVKIKILCRKNRNILAKGRRPKKKSKKRDFGPKGR